MATTVTKKEVRAKLRETKEIARRIDKLLVSDPEGLLPEMSNELLAVSDEAANLSMDYALAHY